MEIAQAVGHENAYIFGAKVEELPSLKANYNPSAVIASTPGLARVIDALTSGILNDSGSSCFIDLKNSLLEGNSWDGPDYYYVLGDFASYRETRDKMAKDYEDRSAWAKKCLINIAKSSIFSSDRTIREYADEIWKIESSAI